MATLIPEVKWTDFLKVQKMGQLGRLKSCEVKFNGEYYFTFVNGSIGPEGYLKTQTEFKCQTDNACGGETLENILKGA